MIVKLIARTILTIALLVPALYGTAKSQDRYPAPPADVTRIYYADGDNKLTPLPFETAVTPVKVFAPATQDKVLRVVLKGAHATTELTASGERFFIFVGDRMDPPPHQLVRLSTGKNQRLLMISVMKGRKGYAPFDNDNIRIERRLLQRLRVQAGTNRFLFVNYMQLRPKQTLGPGEYAIIGDSLADIATFRIK